MSTTAMIESNANEVLYLFEIIKKYGVTCSMEFKKQGDCDPVIGIVGVKIDVEHFGGVISDSLLVKLGDVDLSFNLNDHTFSKYVSDCQIEICITDISGNYSVWFSSGEIQPEGIKEANEGVLVKGINPLNRLQDEGDMWHALMDICIDVERGYIDHIEATTRIISVFEHYQKRQVAP